MDVSPYAELVISDDIFTEPIRIQFREVKQDGSLGHEYPRET